MPVKFCLKPTFLDHYHLKSFIALPIHIICPADPEDLPCQSSFVGVSHPPHLPSSFAPGPCSIELNLGWYQNSIFAIYGQ
jgi:hypothetical protein